jgi:hypothetical protein
MQLSGSSRTKKDRKLGNPLKPSDRLAIVSEYRVSGSMVLVSRVLKRAECTVRKVLHEDAPELIPTQGRKAGAAKERANELRAERRRKDAEQEGPPPLHNGRPAEKRQAPDIAAIALPWVTKQMLMGKR